MKNTIGAIYFDGLCVLCSTEINHYRKQDGSDKFSFIDITDPSFKAESHGIDPFLAHKVMHVRDTNGNLQTGVDAFRAIWREIPKYQFLYNLSEKAAVRSVLELGYKAFVKVRPYLPRKKADCSASPFCEVQNK
ncbi:MAG: DUF393 domain-containing protein [Pseudobdellovibrio sp.]